jgi:hypothetical protein
MDETKREEIALFRYGMILPFLTPEELEWGIRGGLSESKPSWLRSSR